MFEPLLIEKNPELLPAQDFALLRAEGIRRIEALGSALWTDYNVHDPGVTFLELLCYAVTDLGYRTAFPVADLLAGPGGGAAVGGQFHTAQDIFPSHPVTFDDLRRLLVDVVGVRGAWIEKHAREVYCVDRVRERLRACPAGARDADRVTLDGLYDVLVAYEDFVVPERRVERVGLPDHTTTEGGYIRVSDRGILFLVEYPLTLDAVHVYADAPGDVVVRLLDDDGQEQGRVRRHVDAAGVKTRVPLGFRVLPGTYRLTAQGTAVKLFRSRDPSFVYKIEDVVQLLTGVRGVRHRHPYYFFYDWEVHYAVAPTLAPPAAPKAVYAVRVGLEDNTTGPGAYRETDRRGLRFTVEYGFTLQAVHVYADAPGDVVVRLLDDDGDVVQTATVTVAAAGVKTRIPLGFYVPPGAYRLDARGTAARLYTNVQADFPYEVTDVVQLVSSVRGAALRHGYYFFYDWEVEYTIPDPAADPATVPSGLRPSTVTRDDVLLAVRDRVFAARNLCEDVVQICDLEPEEIAVCADVELRPDADVEETLAEIFYRLDRHVSPRVRFYTIDELRAKGYSTERIFEGPLLDHGFLDDDAFTALSPEGTRRCDLRASDLIRIVMGVPGVLAVKSFSMRRFLDGVFQEPAAEWVLPLSADRFRAPVFSAPRSKVLFYKNGLPYYAARSVVDALLADKKSADATVRIQGHARDLPVPAGTYRDLSDYYPAQNELPATYRVGLQRVPASETALRKAQARQLKAYLMFFEQLLANYLAQLAGAGNLFSWNAGLDATYFTRPVTELADVEEVYVDYAGEADLAARLADLTETTAEARTRRLRFLDHLTARFAESFADYSLLMYSLFDEEDAAAARLVDDERAFLADYPRQSRERGRGFDYRYPARPDAFTGYQRRVYALLGIHPAERRNLAGHRFTIRETTDDEWRFVLEDEDGTADLTSIACTSRDNIEGLLDFAFQIGGDEANWRPTPDAAAHELVRRCRNADGDVEEEVIATTADATLLPEVVAAFDRVAKAEGFHVVEHVLLRPRTAADPFLPIQLSVDCDCVEVTDPYSFHASVVLPSWPERFRDLKFRAFVEQTLRLEAPAHVYLKICWLSHDQMRAFERCHNAWRAALARLAPTLGRCRDDDAERPDDGPRDEAPYADHRDALARLIACLDDLRSVYPLARLHDCETVDGDTPRITLDNTRLGTF